MISDRRLYLNRDETAVCEFDTPEAATLLVCEGGELTPNDIAKWGFTLDGEKVVYPGMHTFAKPAKAAKPAAVKGLAVPFLKKEILTNLQAAGFDSIEKLAAASDAELMSAAPTIDDKALGLIRKAAPAQ